MLTWQARIQQQQFEFLTLLKTLIGEEVSNGEGSLVYVELSLYNIHNVH